MMFLAALSGISRHRKLGSALALALLALTGCAMGPRGVSPTHGIANFARVNAQLYRGSQPNSADIQELKRIGVKTIVNLRSSGQPEEEREARRHGLSYVAIPMKGLKGPGEAVVHEALQAIQTGPTPVYVHCRYGCERTGTVIACYRIAHDQWNSERALAEAKFYGMAGWAVPMRRCVRRFELWRLGPHGTMSSSARPATNIASVFRLRTEGTSE